MAETLTIRTASSTEVVKIAVPGPQGPKGDKGDPGDVAGLPLSTLGDTLYRGASENQRLPIGTSGQILKVSAGGIPEWANESGAVSSVAGKTGAVTLDKNDVGLGNVANTAQVTSVTGTAPIVSSGGTTPAISVTVGTTANTVCAGNDARLSDSRTPTAHAASHAAAGSDPVFDQDLNTTDNVEFAQVGFGGDFTIDSTGLNWGGQNIFEAETNTFSDSNGNPAFSVGTTCEFLKNVRMLGPTGGGAAELDADLIATGQTRSISFPDASGTIALAGDAPASHTHGNLTNDGKIGSTSGLPVVTTTAGAVTTLALGTANQVLRVNSGATGVEFADPAASGVTGAASSASDVLGVSGANITGVDAGSADRLVFWDDSANRLTYLEAGSGLTISGTVMTASGGASINQAIAVGFVLN